MLHSRSKKQTARRWGERDSLWSFNQRQLKVLGEMIIYFNSFSCFRDEKCAANVCDGQKQNTRRNENGAKEKVFPSAAGTSIRKIFLLLFLSLFVLQIIQSRKCVLQKLLRPFSLGRKAVGATGNACRRNLINQWLNKEIEKVKKARKFIRRWIEEGGHEGDKFQYLFIYFLSRQLQNLIGVEKLVNTLNSELSWLPKISLTTMLSY